MLTIQLEREKETKNKIRFEESGDTPVLGTIYVPKSTLKRLGDPERLSITLDGARAAA